MGDRTAPTVVVPGAGGATAGELSARRSKVADRSGLSDVQVGEERTRVR
jgi:hypothetical protein